MSATQRAMIAAVFGVIAGCSTVARGQEAAPAPAAAAKPDYLGQWIALIEESQKDLADKANGYVPLREAGRRYQSLSEQWQEQADDRWPGTYIDFLLLSMDDIPASERDWIEPTRWALGEAERAGLPELMEEVAATPRAVFVPNPEGPQDFLGQSIEGLLGSPRRLAMITWALAWRAAEAGDGAALASRANQVLVLGRAVDQQLCLVHGLVGRSLWRLSFERITQLPGKPGFDDQAAAAISASIWREVQPTSWESVRRGELIFSRMYFDVNRIWVAPRPGAHLNVRRFVDQRLDDIFLESFTDLLAETTGERQHLTVRWLRDRWIDRLLASPPARALMLALPRRAEAMPVYERGMLARARAMDIPAWRRPTFASADTEFVRSLELRDALAWMILGYDSTLFPAQNAAEQTDALLCQRDAVLLMLAVERHKLRHGGALPATIEALDADLRPPSMVDQATGEPLKYRLATAEEAAAAGGWRYSIYSVGADKKDDGGRFEAGKDAAFGFYETKPGFDFPLVGVGARR